MGQLIGFFIRIITFPGLILDYYINKKTANFLSIFILKDDFSKVLSGEALEIDTTSKYYKLWFKDPMTYVMGAVLLSVFQIITFAVNKLKLPFKLYPASETGSVLFN